MPIDTKLMNAILAMDSYNRGYNSGVDLATLGVGNQLGNITILQTTIDGKLQNFDSTNMLVDANGAPRDIPIGFYAIAYQDNSTGEVTISYRGTDGALNPKDVLNGYGVGGGIADTPQSRMAFEFYKSVAAALNPSNPDPYAANDNTRAMQPRYMTLAA